MTHFLGRGHVADFVSHLTINHLPVGRFDKAVLVHAGKRGQRVDQTNVRAFRRLNWAHPAVVRWMHVADLKASTFTCQTTRSKRGKTAFVRHFGQRVCLVNELRELRRAKEFTHRSSSRFRVNQVLRHHRVDFDGRHTLFDRALHAEQTNAVLVFHQFANGTHTTVT